MEEIYIDDFQSGSQDPSIHDHQEQREEVTDLFRRQLSQNQSTDSPDTKNEHRESKQSASQIPPPKILRALRSLRPILARRLTNLVLGLLGADAADMPPPDLSEKLMPAKARLMSKALEGLIEPTLGRIETWLGARLLDFNNLSPITTVDQLMGQLREAIHLRLRYDHRQKDAKLTFRAWVAKQPDAPRALVNLDGLLHKALHTQAEKVIHGINNIGPEDLLIRLRHAIFEMAWMIANEEDKVAMCQAIETVIDEYVPETLEPWASLLHSHSDSLANEFIQGLSDDESQMDMLVLKMKPWLSEQIKQIANRMKTEGTAIEPRLLAKAVIPIIVETSLTSGDRHAFENRLTARLLEWFSENVVAKHLDIIIRIIVPDDVVGELYKLLSLETVKVKRFLHSFKEGNSEIDPRLRAFAERAVDHLMDKGIAGKILNFIKSIPFVTWLAPSGQTGTAVPMYLYILALSLGAPVSWAPGMFGIAFGWWLTAGACENVVVEYVRAMAIRLDKVLKNNTFRDFLLSQLDPDRISADMNGITASDADSGEQTVVRRRTWAQSILSMLRDELQFTRKRAALNNMSIIAESILGTYAMKRVSGPESEEKLVKLVGPWFHYVELLGDPKSCGKHVQLFHRDADRVLKGKVEQQLKKANEITRNWLKNDLPGAIYELTEEARATIASGALHRQIRAKATPILVQIAEKKPKKIGCLTIEESEQSDFLALSQTSGGVLRGLIELAHTEGGIEELDSDDSESRQSIPSREEIRKQIADKLYFRPTSKVGLFKKVPRVKDLGSVDVWEELHKEKIGRKLTEGLLKEFMKLQSEEEIARRLTEVGKSLQKSSVKERVRWLKAECDRVMTKLPMKEFGSVQSAQITFKLKLVLSQIESSDGSDRLRLTSELNEVIVLLSELHKTLHSSDAYPELVNGVATIGWGLLELLPRLPKTEAENIVFVSIRITGEDNARTANKRLTDRTTEVRGYEMYLSKSFAVIGYRAGKMALSCLTREYLPAVSQK